MRKLSITTKITIWYTVFLLVITGSLLWTFFYMGNTRAAEITKTTLMNAVVDAREEITHFDGDFVIDKDLVFYENGVYISIYDDTGDLIEGRRPAELAVLPEFKDEKMERLHDDKGNSWYVYDSTFEVNGQQIWVRGIGKDFVEEGMLPFMMKLVVMMIPGLVLVAALGGFIITRRAFRPVRAILGTVEEIRENGDLSKRIDLNKTGGREAQDEIHQLADTFDSMFDRLEETFEKEKQFTSDVSHELRTPLAVIISQSDYAKGDPEYREQALEVINREARRMSGLVNRLLTLSRSDAGRLKLEREVVDFSDMCEMVALQQSSVAEQKNIRVLTDIQPDIKVIGDETMLIRILLNLMENAVKYGKPGGYAKLTLSSSGVHAKCTVSDDGIGIAPEHLSRIWERFYRVDASRTEEGEGLGLSMVDALVKAHGGRVEVGSKPGEGSSFTVSLPLAESDTADSI